MARTAVREQISAAAFRLFTKNGYDKTTVEAIAGDVGMSTRTFFRYFQTKEDVLMNGIHLFRSSFMERFKELLATEDIWEALRLSLIEFALNCSVPGDKEIQVFIRRTPALLARQLEIFENLLTEATDVYISQRPRDEGFSSCMANAIIRCGFSCLQSMQLGMSEGVSNEIFATLMAQMKPAILVKTDSHFTANG